MDQIVKLPVDDRRDVFNEARARLGMPAFYVEKNFWVCWVLGLMFGHETTGPGLTFRGGTSLSKGWDLIDRFSEDIDLAMSRDWVDPALDIANLMLVPPAARLGEWRRDYQEMGSMFIGEPPTFDATIESLAEIKAALEALH